jgi:non-ribosomal peptide synthase protein (TIGR01720 family)
MPQPQVVFSYTGQFDQTLADSPLFALAHESIGPAQDPHGTWPYLLDIYAHVVGGQLTVNWLYSTHVHRRATIERLANSFVATLHDILATPAIGGSAARAQNIA